MLIKKLLDKKFKFYKKKCKQKYIRYILQAFALRNDKIRFFTGKQ